MGHPPSLVAWENNINMVSNKKKYSVDDPEESGNGNGSGSVVGNGQDIRSSTRTINSDYCKEISDHRSKKVEGIVQGKDGREMMKRSDSLIDEDLETPFACSSHCLRAMTTITVDENDMNPLKVKLPSLFFLFNINSKFLLRTYHSYSVALPFYFYLCRHD